MANETLILGDNNWAVKTSNLLGYAVGETSGDYVPREFTFSRASTATYTDKNGIIQTANANIARVQNGALLLEPQRTNSIRNSTMVGAVTGSPGTMPNNWAGLGAGLTRTIVGTGLENGLPYIDIRYNGTATSSSIDLNFENSNQIVATNGQIWTSSLWAKFISNSNPPNNIALLIFELTSTSGFISSGAQFLTLTSSLKRFPFTRTLSGGATVERIYSFIRLSFTVGQTYDFTIRVAQPQIELGAFATTPIFTTGAIATRLADTFTINNIYTNGYIGASGGTWYVELKNNVEYTRDNTRGILLSETSNGSPNSLVIYKGPGRNAIAKFVSGVFTNLFNTSTNDLKIAIKWNGSTADVFVNGVKVVSATAFTATTSLQYLGVESNLGTGTPTFIQSMQLYNTPLTDEELILKTTL